MSIRLFVPFLLVVALALSGCWNGSHNEVHKMTGGERFRLTVEPSRTDVAGTHFLVDSATGDLWRLEQSGGSVAWARLADAPPDAADLTAEEEPEPGAEPEDAD